MLSVLIVLAAVTVSGISGYMTGAPNVTCVDMTPQHGFPAQTIPSPYSFTVSNNAGVYTVNLVKDASAAPFEGFLVQARVAATGQIIGNFGTPPTNAKYVNCGAADNAVTHSINAQRDSATFTWTPPAGQDLTGTNFVATVVQHYDTFWLQILSVDIADV